MAVKLSELTLDPAGPLRREPPRPPQFQQPGYLEEFDFYTVFYDCFLSADGKNQIFIGPPLANLEKTVVQALEQAYQQPGRPWRALRRQRDRMDQIWMPVYSKSAALAPGPFLQKRILVRPNLSAVFRGKKVLLTKNKDNELAWIRDWTHFFAAKHGSNAVLIYDNASTKYDARDLHRTITGVRGIDMCVVVEWPYKFGPQGGPGMKWDSDYCQIAMLEHARHRFLSAAAAVVNADIDEFVLTQDGRSIYEHVLRSETGYLRYTGLWVENVSSATGEPRRHADFIYQAVPANEFIEFKWVVIPSRCADDTQWKVHSITKIQPDPLLSNRVSTRHFRGINTNWRLGRVHHAEAPDERKHAIDRELVEWMRTFEADHAHEAGRA